MEEKWKEDDLIYKLKLEKCWKHQIWEKVKKMMRSARVLEDSFSDLGPPVSIYLSVEGDLERGGSDLQTQEGILPEKSNLEKKSEFHE